MGVNLRVAGQQFFPKPVPVRRPELQLHAQLFKLSPLPVLAAVAGSLALNIEVNTEWFPVLASTIGVARFGQKLFGVFDPLSVGFAVHPVKDRVDASFPFP